MLLSGTDEEERYTLVLSYSQGTKSHFPQYLHIPFPKYKCSQWDRCGELQLCAIATNLKCIIRKGLCITSLKEHLQAPQRP